MIRTQACACNDSQGTGPAAASRFSDALDNLEIGMLTFFITVLLSYSLSKRSAYLADCRRRWALPRALVSSSQRVLS